jgi:hypothetical protein
VEMKKIEICHENLKKILKKSFLKFEMKKIEKFHFLEFEMKIFV